MAWRHAELGARAQPAARARGVKSSLRSHVASVSQCVSWYAFGQFFICPPPSRLPPHGVGGLVFSIARM